MTRILPASLLLALGALPAAAQDPDRAAVARNYSDLALATYGDALTSAQALQTAVEALIATPSEETLTAARDAWRAARVPYMQSEAFRFANPIVDEWEGKVNSWPLDEGLIDYVGEAYGGPTDENPYAVLNVVATPDFTLGGAEVDASTITPELITTVLQEAEGIETNVATGYHAVEFLLWGQDLNGTGPGNGDRPWTDYASGDACTNGNCERRAAYLSAATAQLVTDLQEIVGDWAEDGAARAQIVSDPDTAIQAMLTGLGELSYGEFAGERMKLGLLLHDPEEEQDCFSDNTSVGMVNDAIGIQNVWLGHYTRIDGSTVEGPSLASVVASADPALADEISGMIANTLGKMEAMRDSGMAYDQLIASGNTDGNAMVQAGIDGLTAQTKGIERALTALGYEGKAE